MVKIKPTYPTKKVGMMKDITTMVIMIKVITIKVITIKVITIKVTMIKVITMTGMAEDMATKVITAATMAGVVDLVEEGAEGALFTRWVEAEGEAEVAVSMVRAKKLASRRKVMEEKGSSPLEAILARMQQQYILLQLLLQPLVDEELGVDSTEEGVVAVAVATSMSRPF